MVSILSELACGKEFKKLLTTALLAATEAGYTSALKAKRTQMTSEPS